MHKEGSKPSDYGVTGDVATPRWGSIPQVWVLENGGKDVHFFYLSLCIISLCDEWIHITLLTTIRTFNARLGVQCCVTK